MGKSYENMKLILEWLKEHEYTREVPTNIVRRAIAEVTGVGDKSTLTRYHKSMVDLGFLYQTPVMNIWRINLNMLKPQTNKNKLTNN